MREKGTAVCSCPTSSAAGAPVEPCLNFLSGLRSISVARGRPRALVGNASTCSWGWEGDGLVGGAEYGVSDGGPGGLGGGVGGPTLPSDSLEALHSVR